MPRPLHYWIRGLPEWPWAALRSQKRRAKKWLSLSVVLPDQNRIIVGSRIVPATWVHGFSWKQWRAGLERGDAMFSRPCKAQPRQAPQSQAWILPVFIEKGDFMAESEADVSMAGSAGVGVKLADALARFLTVASTVRCRQMFPSIQS
jgi:hypothetical protein